MYGVRRVFHSGSRNQCHCGRLVWMKDRVFLFYLEVNVKLKMVRNLVMVCI